MSLYYDAADVLSSEQHGGSLKSRIYGLTNVKSKPAQIYALISETAKRDTFLKEVIDKTELLKDEPKLTPLLALLLCHDHFFAKSGIAAPPQHPLRRSIEQHKARLQAEFTRARLRRKCASTDALKSLLDRATGNAAHLHPRWARINTLRTTGADQRADDLLRDTACTKAENLAAVLIKPSDRRSYCLDEHVPELLAFSPGTELTNTEAYRSGHLILQDKASCFPAYLLLGGQDKDDIGDVIDGCAAPGNKTSHLAAILDGIGSGSSKVYACERDSVRSKTLSGMIAKAGAEKVAVLGKQDFLALNPEDVRFRNVTHLLLDPSCSGSGILRREDMPKLALPEEPRAQGTTTTNRSHTSRPKKRKREETDDRPNPAGGKEVAADVEEVPIDASKERLEKLSNLQTRIVEHAMKFPAATRVTYSTCSIHEQENEVVVSRLLASEVARARGWELLLRSQQVEGMQRWKHRGGKNSGEDANPENTLNEEELDACIRCYPDDDDEGTMGFFVCAFHRRPTESVRSGDGLSARPQDQKSDAEDSWEGFD